MSICVSRQSTLRLPVPAVAQPSTQPLAGTRQAGHDRAEGDLGDGGDLLVRQAFQLAEDDRLPELQGQFFHGPSDRLLLILAQELRSRVHGVRPYAVDLLVERRGGAACPLPLEPGVTGVADDRE